jgi:hypothetical protein
MAGTIRSSQPKLAPRQHIPEAMFPKLNSMSDFWVVMHGSQ